MLAHKFFPRKTAKKKLTKSLGLCTLMLALITTGCEEIINPSVDICTDTPLLWVNDEDAPIDYFIDCDLRINDDLVIEPGTVIAFGEGAALRVEGSIKAVGTSSERIVFKGQSEVKGFWDGILIGSNSVKNELDYVDIRHTGNGSFIGGGDPTSLFLNGGRVSLKNTRLSEGKGIGIFASRNHELTAYENIEVKTHDLHPVSIHVNNLRQLDGLGSTYEDNGINTIQIYLTGGSVIQVTTEQTWPAAKVPYQFTSGTMGINAALTIAPGAEFLCPEDFRINISSTGLVGSLNAIGTADNMIRFSGVEPLQGYWTGIALGGNSVKNELSYVEVADGGNRSFVGGGDALANIFIPGGNTFKINNCLIRNSLGCGIIDFNSNATLANNTYADNVRGDLCD